MSGAGGDVVLLTGATGFLGTQVARRLLAWEGARIVALVRAPKGDAAHRLRRAWWEWPELLAALGERAEPLAGDVGAPHLGLDEATWGALARRVTHVVHAAADLRVNAPLDALRRTNVQGTAEVLALARAAQAHHPLARFLHVSTAYVAGARAGEVPEAEHDRSAGFLSAYEESKWEAERLVHAAGRDLPVTVVRPGMIVGDAQTGAVRTFNTFYVPLRLYLSGKARVLPVRADQRVNIVPVDYVADAVARLARDPAAAGGTFHLTLPHEALPTAGEIAEETRRFARERLGVRLPAPVFLPLPLPRRPYRPDRPARVRPGALGALQTLLPYLGDRLVFRRDNTDRLLGASAPDLRAPGALTPLLEYAARCGFLHRSERTVHEQVLFRLASRSRPVSLHDLSPAGSAPRDAAALRAQILAAAAALVALGVRRGDRVALVGHNSTRYLALDVAIGLVGAVSVPLYYTSPPGEIQAILQASGARLLLVGAPRPLAALRDVRGLPQVVSFLEEPPAEGVGDAMPWEAFLALGCGAEESLATSPVEMDDLATIRYTSGTTSRPKGVTFTHRQLRWMGECLASLLPWQVRVGHPRYLSFLPMNHVVEGILATYGAYYAPAPVDVHFLADIRALPAALKRVRPDVFFSVPRVYERVWDRVRATALGRAHARSSGPLRRALGWVLRAALLRGAGWDRCRQLLVGSAPCSEALLSAYGELGVPLHNAYGLTEAPLVTLNRAGRNLPGTVGEPLPETEVRIAPDGEILVRGPQVTPGYFNPEDGAPFDGGWLCTGDLGALTPEGYLTIQGRKKELIATSYGKKVHPLKVEMLLGAIPGVEEAVLVGEARPFCAALLWLAEGHRSPEALGALDRAIARANQELAHPEQVKRWAVLDGALSVESGELTANLKVRRAEVCRRLGDVVAALYGEGQPPAGVLHLGQADREGA